MSPAVYHAAWMVQDGGIAREFCQGAGDNLLRLGMIELDPDPDSQPRLNSRRVMRRYVPTAFGLRPLERPCFSNYREAT
jgi:hypothetical protein